MSWDAFFRDLDRLCLEHGVSLSIDAEHFYDSAIMTINGSRISYLEVGTPEPKWAVGPHGGYSSSVHPKHVIHR